MGNSNRDVEISMAGDIWFSVYKWERCVAEDITLNQMPVKGVRRYKTRYSPKVGKKFYKQSDIQDRLGI